VACGDVCLPRPAGSNGRFRRISPVAPRPREGPLTEPTADAQPWPRERILMPLKRPCRRDRGTARSGGEQPFPICPASEPMDPAQHGDPDEIRADGPVHDRALPDQHPRQRLSRIALMSGWRKCCMVFATRITPRTLRKCRSWPSSREWRYRAPKCDQGQC